MDFSRDRLNILPGNLYTGPPPKNDVLIADLYVMEALTGTALSQIGKAEGVVQVVMPGASSALAKVQEDKKWTGSNAPWGQPIPKPYHEAEQCSLIQPLVHKSSKWLHANMIFNPETPEHLTYGEASVALFQNFSGCIGFKGTDLKLGINGQPSPNGGIPFWDIVIRERPSVFNQGEMRLY
jgi:hypothetical protein